MKTLDAATLAALSAGRTAIVQLVKIEFPGGTIGLNTSNWNFDYDGTTYLGAAGLGPIGAVIDQPGEQPGIQLELQRVDATYLALALDESDEVQGAVLSIFTAILDPDNNYAVLWVERDWIGYADTTPISEDGETCSIGLTAESKGVDLLRGNPSLYNDADQQTLVPGDRYFEYVVDQADKPVVWPTREFFLR